MRRITANFSEKQPHWVGDGFPVRTLLAHDRRGATASPFLLMDYAGPHEFAAKPGAQRGVGSHPHKGFETVTIVYDGEVEHRDSTGAGGVIGPGDVQWMTAGSGVLHQEYHSADFAARGGRFEMVQLWVNLPAADKSATPGYQQINDAQIPVLREAGQITRVIAGDYKGIKGPSRTFTPINLWDLQLSAGAKSELPIPASHNVTVVVLRGEVTVFGTTLTDAQSVVLSAGPEGITLDVAADSRVLVLSGTPIDEPVVQYGPFVMNTETEIREAIADFNSGRFGRISG